MRRVGAVIVILAVVVVNLVACGPPPSPTAVPPTRTPAPTATPTPPPGLPLAAEAFRSPTGGFGLRYPEGWQFFGFGGMVVFYADPAVMDSDAPTDTVVMVEGGPLANLSMTGVDLAAAGDSREMAQLTVHSLAGGESAVEVGEVTDVQVGTEKAAAVDLSGEDSGVKMGGRLVCVYLGDHGVTILAVGQADRWVDFVPTFDTMMASMTFFPPETPTATPEPTAGPEPTATPGVTAAPVPTLVGGPPEGFLWRVGGLSGFEAEQYGYLRGIDIGPDGNLYVADAWHGIIVLAPDGTEVSRFGNDLTGASDVKFGPDGNLYVAAWGDNAVHVFATAGEEVAKFGAMGQDAGEFGDFSPEFLAVCPDGRVYVADENVDADGNTYERIEVFDDQGNYLSEWSITGLVSQTTSYFDISGMDCDAEGKVYASGYFADSVLVFDGEGTLVAELGNEALFMAGAYGVSAGPGGDLYVGTWDGRVVVLDAEGNKLGEWGVAFDGEGALAEGLVYAVYGIVADDYGNVYFSDDTGEYTYVTKFRFGKG